MDTTSLHCTPLDALERIVRIAPRAAITAKQLFCELALRGHLGRDADLLIDAAVNAGVLRPVRDAQYRLMYAIDRDRLAPLRQALDGWRHALPAGH